MSGVFQRLSCLFPPAMCGYSIVPHLANICYRHSVKYKVIVVDVCLIIVLICIFLINTVVELLFMYSFIIRVHSLMKWLIKLVAQVVTGLLFTGLFFFLISHCKNSFNILDSSPLSDWGFRHICSCLWFAFLFS